MQSRHDGYLGFPGGFVDSGETWEQAANRELHEEINFNPAFGTVTDKHYIYSSLYKEKNWILHFYAMPISVDHFLEVEKNITSAHHYGTEVITVLILVTYFYHFSL